MNFQHKVGQIRNLFRKLPDRERKLDWVFIYGLPRSGTSYVLNQFLKVSRCGIGDWELKEFFRFIQNTRERDYVTLDTGRAMAEMRDNILDNAHVGGGRQLDIVVKQIDCTEEEFEYLKELFGGPPREKFFFYREPGTWLASAKEKFGIEDEEAIELYERSLLLYEKIGGKKLEYREDLEKRLQEIDLLKGIPFDNFGISRVSETEAPYSMKEAYSKLGGVSESS